jgi:hypothetical protein
MSTRRSFIGLLVAALGFLALGAAEAQAQTVNYFVQRTGGGLYEIRDGSGTGGRFVYQPRTVAGVYVHGYTDRAERGENLLIWVQGSGCAQYANIRSDNGVINLRSYNVWLPAWTFGQVWLNPHVDNVYTSVKLPGCPEVRRRLPIGTRP